MPLGTPASASGYAPLNDEQPPSLRKPSQAYVDSYIARRTPVRTPTAAAAVATPVSEARSRSAPRIFYKLEKDCPPNYFSALHTVSSSLRTIRAALLLLCIVQLLVAFSILYATAVTHYLHDPSAELFTEFIAALCAFAACVGFVGVLASSRNMLLVLYVNQLWSLSNVSTYAVIQLTSEEQGAAACALYETGELTAQQLADQGLDCDQLARTARLSFLALLLLVCLLWGVCFLSKMYSEMLQDKANDEQDAELVNFVWRRRGETWAKLEKFEELVNRQFEELRMSLVAHAHHAQAASRSRPSPLAPPGSSSSSHHHHNNNNNGGGGCGGAGAGGGGTCLLSQQPPLHATPPPLPSQLSAHAHATPPPLPSAPRSAAAPARAADSSSHAP